MSLAKLLDDQRRCLSTLNQLLEQEQAALAATQVDGTLLGEIAAGKQTLLAELEQRETLRRQVQVQLGYAPDANGSRAAARDADCLSIWESCLSATRHTARLNALAGQLLGMRLQHNQQMLDIIHRVAEKTLYDPSGRTGRQPGRLNASA